MAGIEELRETLGITELRRELAGIRVALERLQPETRPQWYNLRLACQVKGVVYSTLKGRPALQPGKGIPDAIVTGRRMWRRETIETWLNEVDP